jgi:glutathione S-transferase
MILIGQYDSGFVRRVAIALRLYDIAFEHWPWSVFGDAERLKAYNPLVRVPTLVLDDGDVILDSHAMIDYLDRLVGPSRALLPQTEPLRHQALKIISLATGVLDKGVSRFYEQHLHDSVSPTLLARLSSQIESGLAALEADRATRQTPYWFGDQISHADIAVTCMLRHMKDAQPDLFEGKPYPTLTQHAVAMEEQPLFIEISQPFIPPTSRAG